VAQALEDRGRRIGRKEVKRGVVGGVPGRPTRCREKQEKENPLTNRPRLKRSQCKKNGQRGEKVEKNTS